MALSEKFNTALNEKNYRLIKIMMENSMLFDSSFSDFNEMDAVVKGIPGFYEEHDGKEFENDRSKWNEEYLANLTVQTTKNFSHERVAHLKDVVRYLRPPVKQNTKSGGNRVSQNGSKVHTDKRTDYQKQKAIDQANGNFRPQKIAFGAGIGAVAGATIMAVASGPIIIGAVGGAAVGAGVAVAATNMEI